MPNYDDLKQRALSTDPHTYFEALTGHTVDAQTGKTFCPFHENTKTEAFVIHRTEGYFFCNNETCAKKGGDIISLTMQLKNVSFREALEIITGDTIEKVQTTIRKKKVTQDRPKQDMFTVGADKYTNALTPVDHAYIARKKISTEVLKMAGTKQLGNRIITPLVIGPKIVQWQFIDEAGGKKTYGSAPNIKGMKIGGVIKLGEAIDGEPILLGEGFATCASAWQATHRPTVCAVSSSNMMVVARLLRAKYKNSTIVLLQDTDPSGAGQTTCANIMIEVSNTVTVIPQITGQDKVDINDVYLQEGKIKVGRIINRVLAQEVNPIELSPCGKCEPDGMSKVFDGANLNCTNCGRCYNELPAGLNAGQINYSEQVKKAALVHLYG